MRGTVHTGPKGGVQYRLWDDARGTFRVVGRFKAWPHMSDSERAKAEGMEASRRAEKSRAASDRVMWRSLRAGR